MLSSHKDIKRLLWFCIALFSILQLLFAFLTNSPIFTFDEAMWHYIGRNWFRFGLTPYTGGVDNKSPLIYIIYGVSDYLFGVNFWFPRVVAIAFESLGVYYVYKLVTYLAGSKCGFISIIVYSLSLLWNSVSGKTVSLTQTYEVTFLILSFYLFVTTVDKRNYFLSGIFSGIAFAFRFTAGFSVAVLIFFAVRRNKNFALTFIMGLLLIVSAFVALFPLLGISVREFIFYSFTDNFGEGSVTSYPLAWKLQQFSKAFFQSGFLLFYPFVLTYILIKKQFDLFLFWFISTFISITIIGMYAKVHLKELLPPLSIMSAIAITHLITVFKIQSKTALVVLSLFFFPKTLEPLAGLKRILLGKKAIAENCGEPYTENEDAKKAMGLWIKANTNTYEKVLIAGDAAQVQVYSERLSPSIYFNVTETHAAKKRFFKDIISNKPDMIVIPLFTKYTTLVSKDIQAFLSNTVKKDYHAATCLYNYQVYRKNSIQNYINNVIFFVNQLH